jgi:hypothetical protein
MIPNDRPRLRIRPSFFTSGAKSASNGVGRLRRSRLLGYALAALIIGILFVAFVIFLYWVSWRIWGSDQASSDGSSFGDKLSLAQVVAALVATWVAGALGFFAYREFHDRHKAPELELVLRDADEPKKELVLLRNDPGESFQVSFSIRNRNQAVATWYKVTLQLPFLSDYWLSQNPRPRGNPDFRTMVDRIFTKRLGERDKHWEGLTSVVHREGEEVYEFTQIFRSQGEIGVYQIDEVTLCSFTLPASVFTDTHFYECDYEIVADHSDPVVGTLKITTIGPTTKPVTQEMIERILANRKPDVVAPNEDDYPKTDLPLIYSDNPPGPRPNR